MRKLLYIFALALVFAACKKDKDASTFGGTYKGTFWTKVNGQVATNEAIIVLKDKSYKSLKGKGSGSFNFEDMGGNKVVNFTDENVWTADFDWNLILSGTFSYKTKGDSLILERLLPYTAANADTHYQYRLKRIR